MKHLTLAFFMLGLGIIVHAQTSITSTQSYAGASASGDYTIYSSGATTLSQVDKPLVLIEGWDPLNIVNSAETQGLFNLKASNFLVNQLKSGGYDVIVLNFTDGGDYIQRNAFVLVELIKQINAAKQGNEKLTVCGLSTGGLIARYALAWMEVNSIAHNVGLYISIDAPHKGVCVPPSLQYLTKKFIGGMTAGALSTLMGFETNLAKQLLVHKNQSEGLQMGQDPLFATFFNELNSLNGNGFPHLCRNITLSNGNRSNVRNGEPNILALSYRFSITDLEIPPGIVIIGGSDGRVTVSSCSIGTIPPQLDFMPPQPAPGDRMIYGFEVTAFTSSSTFEVAFSDHDGMELASGGYMNLYKPLGDFIRNQTPESPQRLDMGGSEPYHCFVPTTSALAFSNNWYYDMNGDANFSCSIPFDDYYVPNDENQAHASLSTIASNWLFDQIVTGNISNITNSYNFGAKTPTIISRNINVKSGAIMGVNLNQATDFASKNSFYNNSQPVPGTGSTFSVSTDPCKSSIITVENGGKLQIGASPNYGILTIDNGSKLVVKSGGKLDIRYGSKLILKNGGRLVFESGADVNLQDNESVIEVQEGGIIEIGPNATFQWTGVGYVKINVTSKTVSNIIASAPNTNAKFAQTGKWINNGWNQKVIEVTNGSLSIDKSLTKFSVISGVIMMGQYTMIDVDPEMDFSGVKIKAIDPNRKFSGIWVYGQQNVPYLRNCVVENADIGLRVFTAKATSPVAKVLNTNFITCDIGVVVYGKSAEITGGSLWGNKTGIFLDAVQNVNTIKGVTAYGNRSAVDVIGSGTDLVNIRGAYFYNNSAVGTFAINSTVSPGCSRITNNYLASNPAGGNNVFLREFSLLAIEPATWKDAEKNNLSSTASPSVGSWNAKGFALDKGKTDFNTPAALSIWGSLQKTNMAYPTVLAGQNYWNTAATAPVMNVDYSVSYQTSSSTNSLVINGAGQLTATPDLSGCAVVSPPWTGGGQPSAFIGKPTLTLQDGTPIDVKFKSGLGELYVQTPNYVKAIDHFTAIIMHPYQAQTFVSWYDVIDLSYRKAMEALGNGIANGTIAQDGEITSPVKKVLDAQDRMLQYLQGNPNEFDNIFKLQLDQALVYRLINDRNTARDLISILQGDEGNTATTTRLLKYYACVIDNEMSIIEGAEKLDYIALDGCRALLQIEAGPFQISGERPADPVFEEGMGKTREVIDTKEETSVKAEIMSSTISNIKVYPNPAQDLVYIDIPSEIEVNKVNVIDITGRLVQSVLVQQGTNRVTINLNVDNGTYFIEIISEKRAIERKKITVLR
jgi:hypothetical protein